MTLALDIHHQQGDFTLEAAFEAGPGVLALFGASGSGKTTLIDIVAGLVRPGRARIALDGTVLTDTKTGMHVPPHRRRIGYVFQEARLFPHLTVRQNLGFGRWFAGAGDLSDAPFAEVVDLLGLGSLLARAPRHLSGGEKQRVAIGRALLSQPRLLIMDEPLASLDQPRREEILPYLLRLRDEAKLPLIYVSHSVTEVARLAATVAVLQAGRLIAFGPVGNVLQHGEQLPAGEEGEASSIIETRLDAAPAPAGLALVRSAGNGWQVPATGPMPPPGTRLRLRVRARDVMIGLSPPADISALNILRGKIAELRRGGAGATDILIDCAGDRLVARLTDHSVARLRLSPGVEAYAIVKALAFEPV